MRGRKGRDEGGKNRTGYNTTRDSWSEQAETVKHHVSLTIEDCIALIYLMSSCLLSSPF